MADDLQTETPPRGRGWKIAALIFAFSLLFIGALIWLGNKGRDIRTPELRKARLRSSYLYVGYPFHEQNPFPGGKVWLWATTNPQTLGSSFLFDLEKNEILGEADASPEVYNETDKTFLFGSREVADSSRAVDNILSALPRDKKRVNTEAIDYWIMKEGQPGLTRVTTCFEHRGAGGGSQASPLGNYFRARTTTGEHFVIDIKNAKRIDLPATESWMGGWWSDDEALFMDSKQNLILFNMKTLKPETLLSIDQINAFLKANGLAATTAQFGIRQAWDGDHFEFYIVDEYYRTGLGWLIKIDKPTRSLKLVDRNFPFHRTGKLNGKGTRYVYSGETNTGDGNAVIVYNIEARTSSTLVAGSATETYYSLPNFYKDRIIYVQKQAIWSVNVDGSGRRQLFPPVADQNTTATQSR